MMFKYWLNMYRKHKYPELFCDMDKCFNELTMLRVLSGIGLCQDCHIDLMVEELEYEIYEYLGGGNYGFN